MYAPGRPFPGAPAPFPDFTANTRSRANSRKVSGVIPQVILDERGHEVVAVVVAFLATQLQPDAGLLAGGFQQVRLELLGKEVSAVPWSTRRGGPDQPRLSTSRLASQSPHALRSVPR